MNAPRPSLLACALRALSPALVLTIATVFCVVALVVRHVALVRDAVAVRDRVEHARLSIAAQTIMLEDPAAASLPCQVELASRQYLVSRDGRRVHVATADATPPERCAATMLAGGAPAVLAAQRTALDAEALAQLGGGLQLPADRWPQLRDDALRDAVVANRLLGFYRDPEIALRLLRVGTDREDFVFDPPAEPFTVARDLLLVNGNLWLPADRELHLPRDLVMVVQGNLYLRGSLRVRGGGRLVLVTRCPAGDVVFADRDGDGCWSDGDRLRGADRFAGAAEGGGGVWLGPVGDGDPLRCDASLLVAGELHVVGHAAVHGPLAVRRGVTLARAGRLLRDPSREWAFAAGRANLPAFELRGVPRPGRLEFLVR